MHGFSCATPAVVDSRPETDDRLAATRSRRSGRAVVTLRSADSASRLTMCE